MVVAEAPAAVGRIAEGHSAVAEAEDHRIVDEAVVVVDRAAHRWLRDEHRQ